MLYYKERHTERANTMSQMKKIMVTLLAILVFAGVTTVFANVIRSSISHSDTPEIREMNMDAYPRAITEPVQTDAAEETEPIPTEPETLPPETEPAETVPPETEPARIRYDSVPLYDMTDYPDILYRSGTLATSGSNITCLAMVASYLTGHEYRPDALAACFSDFIGNHIQWLDYAAEQLQLPWEKAENFHVAKQALQEGKIVITLMGEKSIFTQSQHFIVLTGINDAGRITVNDPYGPHYTQWNLEKGLVEGFEDVSIITGYHGSWIFDPAAVGEDPFIYEMPENTDTFRYPGIELTQEDKDLMAKLIYMEGQSEPFEGQQAIAEVILNRLAADNFPDSVKSIIYAEGQFRSASQLSSAKPTHTQYEAIERALNGPYVLPGNVVFFATYKVNDNVWGTIGAHTFCHQW